MEIQPFARTTSIGSDENASGVSWAAVFAGASVIAALSIAMLALGVGLGLSAVSPWRNAGMSAAAAGWSAVIWLVLMQLVAGGIGGYLSGRLRTKWATIHTDEVYFRDTVHGFLSWTAATVVTAAFLATTAAAIVTSAAAGAVGTSGDAARSDGSNPVLAYYVDELFRTDRAAGSMAADGQLRGEGSRVLAAILAKSDSESADTRYLADMVAARTNINRADASSRVSTVVTEARAHLDTVRKAEAHMSIWSFIALLIGAFSASAAATIGGRQRDTVVVMARAA